MQINSQIRWLLLFLLLSTCLLVTYGKRGGGSRGGSRGSSSRGSSRGTSRNRPTYRPAPAPARPSPRPVYRPSPKPAPKPTQKPHPPSPRPTQKLSPSPKPSAPDEPVVVKQPAANPNFKETNPVQGAPNKQPAYNPNYKPESGAPAGPPPPYSPAGQPAPSAPLGPPPPYGAPGQRPPYPQQPPPYPGQPGRPPAYPGQSAPYPVQSGNPPYPQQPGYPGGYPQQPGMNRPYPVQPGYPGGYPQQPGAYNPYPGGNRPYPQQPLGGNVWQPQSGMKAPAYMSYGGIPTGTNMYSKPHKQKGFLGSLMGLGSNKPGKHNKYYGSYPSPYGIGGLGRGGIGGGGFGHRGGSLLGKYGRTAAMYTILPYVAYKAASALFRPRFMFMPMFSPMPYYHHYHHSHELYPRYAHFYDVYDNDYVGRCLKPIKKEHTDIRCRSTYEDIKCDAKCQDGYEFPSNITLISNRCWHATGVWRPNKNFPACTPICDNDCMNGGECIQPNVCKCPTEFRGSLCQFRNLDFVDCDVRKLTKGEKNVGWVCKHFKNETECTVRCKEPAEFESPAADVYTCLPQDNWTPSFLPRCVVK